MKMKGFVDRKH